ncbi:hypothetical protein [Krasilnikovia cinnamomea]|uniref:hypothetical protein n=1 Tax=Krasilnikovia cinnamomea TaxID=349313 RepID=UPI0013EEFFE1|nr:hypothetical protein [Krasilnikovia cinnamomea]
MRGQPVRHAPEIYQQVTAGVVTAFTEVAASSRRTGAVSAGRAPGGGTVHP